VTLNIEIYITGWWSAFKNQFQHALNDSV